MQVVSAQNVTSVTVQAERKTRYYWAVDAYVGSENDPIYGPIFTFLSDNLVPQVDAGPDIVTWLEGGPRTGALDATVTDDGTVMPYTVVWTVKTEPAKGDAMIETPNAEATNVMLGATGQYVLQLALRRRVHRHDVVTIKSTTARARPPVAARYVTRSATSTATAASDRLPGALLEEHWPKTAP
jgi:hypothetical protein